MFATCCRATSVRVPSAAMSTAFSSETRFKYIVLGGGNSAGYVAKAFSEQNGSKDQLALISRDHVPPFERPALSKAFLNESNPARLPGFHTCVGTGSPAQDEEWYKNRGIHWYGQQNVTNVDLQKKTLTTSTGSTFMFERLIIATGVEANCLPSAAIKERNNDVRYLRSISDAESLYQTMKLHPGGKVVVVGGGYIATEVVAKLLENNLQVTMVFPDVYMMNRLFTPELAKVYAAAFTSRGVKVITSTIKNLVYSDQGKLSGVDLNNDTQLECDFVVAGIGARADLNLFKGKLDLDQGGIKVDYHLRTSHPDVFAIGDIAAFPLSLENDILVRQEHVHHARESARHVVQVLLADNSGDTVPKYKYLPYFYSRCLSFNWKFYGINQGQVTHFGQLEEGMKYGAIWVRDGKVVGTFLNDGTDEEHERLMHIAETRPNAQTDEEIRVLVQGAVGQQIISKL